MVAVSVLACFLASAGGVLASVGGGAQDALAPLIAERRNLHRKPSRRADNATLPLNIDVVVHVITPGDIYGEGYISDDRLTAQMEVLNHAFEPVGYQFTLTNTTRTINANWYNTLLAARPAERQVSAALRQGNLATLNIYSMGVLNTIEAAWATIPSTQASYDGVYMNNTAFLGGTRPLNEGITLVHEVGHWFGLNHVFDWQCDISYDYVDDTPHQLSPDAAGGCEIGRDTCPGQPGVDSVHNYMSYSDDYCRNEWTPGQIQRMREQVSKFRGVVYPGIDLDTVPEDGS